MANNHVIFIHPDGASPAQFAALRFVDKGPDGQLNWDTLPNAAVYLGHMQDQLTGTSNGGAVTHATGVKVYAESFGLNRKLDANGNPIDLDPSPTVVRFEDAPLTALSGKVNQTIMQEAVAAGKATALINSGVIAEPGTGAFAAQVGYSDVPTGVSGFDVFPRAQFARITEQVVRSGIDVILGGGLVNYLPVGTNPPAGASAYIQTAAQLNAISTSVSQRPSINLIELAQSLGYTVVYTKAQLDAVAADPRVTKVLGIFAAEDTFNDNFRALDTTTGITTNVTGTEEGLLLNTATPRPLYVPSAPTVGEMLAAAQKILERNPKFANGSLTVLEEEGTDNFGNTNNTPGLIEALRRTDSAIGVAQSFLARYPNTLLITAADSEAGGPQVEEVRFPTSTTVPTVGVNPTATGIPARVAPVITSNRLDGETGSTASTTFPWDAFTSAAASNGMTANFGIGWVGTPDFAGNIVTKAQGLNADKLTSTIDNTEIYRLMYLTLFGVELASPIPAPKPVAAPAVQPTTTPRTGNAIFIHPDGASLSYYSALRFVDKGPDGRLNWDLMSKTGVYLGHLEDQLTGTSNAGAVVHAMGVKAQSVSYGLDAAGNPYTSLSGKVGTTILEEARDAGKSIAIINSGFIAEPGTGAFLASVANRNQAAEVTEQVVRSGADPNARIVILGGGLRNYLPVGTNPPAGASSYATTAAQLDNSSTSALVRPTTNLITLAQSLGFTVVYTLEQLQALPANTQKVLGIFAINNTYNDRTEEALGLNTTSPTPLYATGTPGATVPTVAQMLQETLRIVSTDPDGFAVVLEEEGTDNFGNANNAIGAIEATRRADAALGVAMDFIRTQSPNTILLTAADSEAGGLQVWQPTPFAPGFPATQATVPTVNVNPTLPPAVTDQNPLDGETGSTASPLPWNPFDAKPGAGGPGTSAPNASGAMGSFGIGWVGTPDFPGNIVVKAYGQNADLLSNNRPFIDQPGSSVDNTDIYRLMYTTLFVPNGTNGDDTLLGTQAFDNADQIYGFGGNDIINSLGGNDRIFGGAGNDTMLAGAGNDLLAGETGYNSAFGGTGRDIFVLSHTLGSPSFTFVYDYEDGVDRLGLSGSLTFEQLQIGSAASFGLSGSSVITLRSTGEILGIVSVAPTLLTASDFVRV